MKIATLPATLSALLALSLLSLPHAAAGESARLLECRENAAKGDASAMTDIGVAYFNGTDGVGQDRAEGLKWFKKGAAAGNENAMNNLGIIYRDGIGVEADQVESHAWFMKAAEVGHTPAQFSVGKNYHDGNGVAKDFDEAEKWLLKVDEYPPAVRMLGVLEYSRFRETGEGRPERAAEFMRKAAEMGDVTAKYNLGVFYENGIGVSKDDNMAVLWFTVAAQGGESAAQLAIGRRFLTGEGVKQNYDEARRWLEEALKNGEEKAKAELAKLPESARTVKFTGKVWGMGLRGLVDFNMELIEEAGGFTGEIVFEKEKLHIATGVMNDGNNTFSGRGTIAGSGNPEAEFTLFSKSIGRVLEGKITVQAPGGEEAEISFVAERPARVQTIVVSP